VTIITLDFFQEYSGRKSLETTLEEVDRLRDKVSRNDHEKYVCVYVCSKLACTIGRWGHARKKLMLKGSTIGRYAHTVVCN
jgi:hypothetical protein